MLNQPIVDIKRAFHPLGSMVRDHHDGGIFSGHINQLAQLLVQVFVVITDSILEGIAGLEFAMLGVMKLPEAVLNPIWAHIDHHKKVPGFLLP